MLKKYDQKISLVINLKVDNSILVKRISGRFLAQFVKNHLMNFLIRQCKPSECTNKDCKKEI